MGSLTSRRCFLPGIIILNTFKPLLMVYYGIMVNNTKDAICEIHFTNSSIAARDTKWRDGDEQLVRLLRHNKS